LARFGHRIGQPHARRAAASGGIWPRWAAAVTRHPTPALLAGLAVMVALSIPALSLRLGQSDAGNDPGSLTTRRAYDLLAQGFGPGFNGPLLIAARLPASAGPPQLTEISKALRRAPGVAGVARPALGPDRRTAVFQVIPASAPQAARTTDLVKQLRDRQVPPLERNTHAQIYVGGPTATWVDFSHSLGRKLPLFIAVVVLLAGLLLAAVFRSALIPLQAALMNLLTISASLGVVVAVFQKGWLGGLFGVKGGPIEAFIPVLVFAIVFGLSMDYEVFLISRIHEEWGRGRDAHAAVVRGLGSTGRVITAAALIMCCVFVSFILGDQRLLKLFGLALASAVFLDAFIVRSLLLPATLALLDRYAWALPGWLDRRLPRIAIEAPTPATEPV
ncbi:MAG TPA: MMPL family transporter, partial [Gaiellales bacterium]|nr:MMPL family transporter [Gaiellales bacterium]